MREELDKQLCEAFPKLFRDRYAPMTTTCMCWGFSHGDGWFNIIHALCANIQHHIDWKRQQRMYDLLRLRAARRGRESLLKFICKDREPREWDFKRADEIIESVAEGRFKVTDKVHQVVVEQVKEKFGTLRFYYQGGDDQIHGMVRMAEAMSAVTCEQCGVPAKTGGRGWISTLCDSCREELNKR